MSTEIQILKEHIQALKQEFSEKLHSLETRLTILENQQVPTDQFDPQVNSQNISQDISQEQSQTIAQQEGLARQPSSSSASHSIPLQKQATDGNNRLSQDSLDSQDSIDSQNSVDSQGSQDTQNLAEQKSESKLQTEAVSDVSAATAKESQPEVDPWMHSPNSNQKQLTSWSQGAIAEFFANFLGPLYGILNKIFQTYQHYQEQGKAPAFFMTVTGIIAMTAGFGYLLQYSFNNLLGDFAKVFLGFLFANGLIVLGWKLNKNRQHYSEYGAALIGLGLTLNYLSSYFISPYYSLVENTASMALLIVITAVGYVLALLLNTRIVSVVALIGGATTPIFMADQTVTEVSYLAYLWVLTIAAVRMSQKINWQPLLYLALTTYFLMIELGLNQGPNLFDTNSLEYSLEGWVRAALLVGFFYLFTLGGFYSLKANNQPLDKTGIIYFSSNLFFFIYAIGQVIPSSVELGTLYIFNSLIVGGICFLDKFESAIKFKLGDSFLKFDDSSDKSLLPTRAILLLYAGILFAVGITQLVKPGIAGFVWTLEAIMLMYLGLKLKLTAVRMEAWIVLSFGGLQVGISILQWLFVSSDLRMDSEWLGLFLTGAAIYGFIKLVNKFSQDLVKIELTFLAIVQETLSIWISATFLILVAIISDSAIWISSAILIFTLLFRANAIHSKYTEYFALSHYLLIILQVLLSAEQANSWRFSEQDWIGQFARIEALFSLWLIPAFYVHFFQNGSLTNFAAKLRVLFFLLLPVIFLPKVARSYDEFLPLALWLSSLIAFFLHYKLQLKLLLTELKILTILAALISVIACFAEYTESWNVIAVPGLLLGALLLSLLTYFSGGFHSINNGTLRQLGHGLDNYLDNKLENGSDNRLIYKSIQTLGYFYYIATVFILVFGSLGSLHWAVLSAVLANSIVLTRWPVAYPIRNQIAGFHKITLAITLAILIITAFNPNLTAYNLISLPVLIVIVGYFVHVRIKSSRILWKVWGGQHVQLKLFHGMVLLGYVGLVNNLFDASGGAIISVCLVLHAILVLLQSARQSYPGIIYIAVSLFVIASLKILLWDMSDFVLVEKIVAFMAIGAMLLLAAYLYQKQRNKVDKHVEKF